MIDLAAIIENEWFIVCDLLPADQFIKFCRDRGIDTSRELGKEIDVAGNLLRPITSKIWELIQLANKNYQPIRLEDWRRIQQGQFLRGPKDDSLSPDNSSIKS